MQPMDAVKWLVGVAVSAFLVGFGAYKYLQNYDTELRKWAKEEITKEVDAAWTKRIDTLPQRISLPVGTIIASTDAPDRLQAANGGGLSSWVICDGRDAPNESAYRKHIATRVPDLRGQFLRGANVMGQGGPASDESRLNPDATPIGSYQSDDFKSHNHEGNVLVWFHEGGGGPTVKGVIAPGERNSGKAVFSVPNDGGKETRPKNVAVAFYVKVN